MGNKESGNPCTDHRLESSLARLDRARLPNTPRRLWHFGVRIR